MAREAIQTSLELNKLRPDYLDCGRICALSRQRQKEYCDACAVKTIEDGFRADCLEQFKTVDNENYSFDSVLSDYYNICSLEASVGDIGYNADWTVLLCRLVDVVRSERNRIRRIDRYNYEQSLKNQSRS